MDIFRFAAVLFVSAALLLSGCSDNQNQGAVANAPDISIREADREADPRGAAEAIYASLERDDPEELSYQQFIDYYNITPECFTEFVAYRTSAIDGLSDIAIVKPAPDKEDSLRERLYAYKDARMDEFRNYDILDAYAISQNAIIFNQGDYLVMLMLRDNEAAQDLLDELIPPHGS